MTSAQLVAAIAEGMAVTAALTLASGLLAAAIALPVGFARAFGSRATAWPATVYVEFFRGTSLLVQLFWLFFVLPLFGVSLPPFATAVVALGLNYGAYGAEIVRGALLAVPRAMHEAAGALALRRAQAFRLVVLPLALVLLVRPWGTLMVQLLKATSLVSLVTVAETTFRANQLAQLTLDAPKVFGAVLLAYLAMSGVIAGATALAAAAVQRRYALRV
ncbi:ectoine/hydroxyectoine ABC transporter permease subunit EhuC [Falsiroseomonas oryzae]|uniref:ectoine/hydroxyectoine ABC transporter permease subunit EhuC n=1 Tax=Falsiroseomonas oryzae TaxID=2766473 RepID=UPI0022EB60D8|nr:ectoine/hydroxyectoine ABC transporter permease subunit EhuC [Roseomonas sp. MO-31]